MTPEQRQVAGRAVMAQIVEMGTTLTRVAAEAGVDRTTLSGLVNGRHWPHQDTRDRICKALGWVPGEIARRGLLVDGLSSYSIRELLCEVLRRFDDAR